MDEATRAAIVLRDRLETGDSWLDAGGAERFVFDDGRRHKPRGPLPSVEDLKARFRGMEATYRPDGLEALTARMRDLREEHEARIARRRHEEGEEIGDVFARVLSTARAADECRKSLPCYPLDPVVQPGDGRRSDEAATVACQQAKAYATCPFAPPRGNGDYCARTRVDAKYEGAARALQLAQVPADHARQVLAAMAGHRVDGKRVAPVPMQEREAMQVVRWWHGRRAGTTLGRTWTGEERILVLSGPGREGKSTAFAWALAQSGGRYITAESLARIASDAWDPGEFVAAPLLAIDELGTEAASDVSRARLNEVLIGRYAALRRTLIGTNLPRRGADGRSFAERYDERINKRIAEGGAWMQVAAWAGAAREV